jgi:hypothetical protein
MLNHGGQDYETDAATALRDVAPGRDSLGKAWASRACRLRRNNACATRALKLERNLEQTMADTNHAPHQGYSPDMDGPTHEATYDGFVRFAEIGSAVVICWVLALAVGGIKHAWLSAVLAVLLVLMLILY